MLSSLTIPPLLFHFHFLSTPTPVAFLQVSFQASSGYSVHGIPFFPFIFSKAGELRAYSLFDSLG